MTLYTEEKKVVVLQDPDGADVVILDTRPTVVRNEVIPAHILAIAQQGPMGPMGPQGPQGPIGNAGGMYVQPDTPVGAAEGNLWYKSDTEDLFVYREVSPSVFNWVAILLGEDDSDVIDGGTY